MALLKVMLGYNISYKMHVISIKMIQFLQRNVYIFYLIFCEILLIKSFSKELFLIVLLKLSLPLLFIIFVQLYKGSLKTNS